MEKFTDLEVKNIMDNLLKGVDKVVGEDEIAKKIKEGKKMIVKFGMDPTSSDLHLGHSVCLRKLKQLQDLGNEIVIIVGDFTARIGDPSGKSKMRPALSKEQVLDNAKTYLDQMFKILDKDKTKITFNSQWLKEMDLEEVLRLLSEVTVARMMEREDFSNRFSKGVPIGIHEFVYPLLQARDSIHLDADIEMGGSDQTFNLLMGRTLQKSFNQEPQSVILMPLLVGLDGVEKMSKSLGNYVGISEDPKKMFLKLMSIPDDLIMNYFTLTTDLNVDELREIEGRLQKGENPRDIKIRLAEEVVLIYHGREEMEKASKFFKDSITGNEIPQDIKLVKIKGGSIKDIAPILKEEGLVSSTSEFRRLLEQGGIKVNGRRIGIEDTLNSNDVLQIGKKEFIKVDII